MAKLLGGYDVRHRIVLRTWHDHSRGWRSRWLRRICKTDVIHITLQVGEMSYHCDRWRSGWIPTYPLWSAYKKSGVYSLHRELDLGFTMVPVRNNYPQSNTLNTMLKYFFGVGKNENCGSAIRQALGDNGFNVPDFITAPLDIMEYVDDHYRIFR